MGYDVQAHTIQHSYSDEIGSVLKEQGRMPWAQKQGILRIPGVADYGEIWLCWLL